MPHLNNPTYSFEEIMQLITSADSFYILGLIATTIHEDKKKYPLLHLRLLIYAVKTARDEINSGARTQH